MVGGLVQQEDVRILQNEPAQIHPGLLPAGEAGEELGAHLRGNGQAVCHLAHCRVRIIPADALKLGGQLPVPAQSGLAVVPRRHGGGQPLHLLRQLLVAGEGGVQNVVHRVPLGIHGDLGDEAQAAVFGDHHLALVGLQLPGENPEEGGLPRAVSAQQAHPLAGLDLEGHAVQNVVPYFKGFFQFIDADFYHGFFLSYTVCFQKG